MYFVLEDVKYLNV